MGKGGVRLGGEARRGATIGLGLLALVVAAAFDLLLNGQPVTATTVGHAVPLNGQWKVARATICDVVGRGGIHCI